MYAKCADAKRGARSLVAYKSEEDEAAAFVSAAIYILGDK